MAGTQNNNAFNSQLFLSPNQQDLLMAALNSNNPNAQEMFKNGNLNQGSKQTDSSNFDLTQAQQNFSMNALDGMDPTFFASPQQDALPANFNAFDVDDSPYVDFLDGDQSFDFDGENGDLLIGSIPGSAENDSGSPDSNDKRKSPEDGAEENGSGKRREGEDKTAKKPGRKPLTSEPTSKRKAQNRAAQRAFRERKEKHLKDLETKVDELTKASDAANHENGLLRAQVQRLQTELREYRKRLSANSSPSRTTSQPNNSFSYMSGMNGIGANNAFQFEFPRFGGLPGTHMLNNNNAKTTTPVTGKQASAPGVLARNTSSSLSPARPQSSSPNVDSSAELVQVKRGSTDSTYGSNSNFASKTQSTASNTNSPSESSPSQYGGPSSSCGTSPEPSTNSPNEGPRDSLDNGYVCHGNSEGEITFCEKLNMACGNPRNPIPRAMSISNATAATPAAAAPATKAKSPTPEVNGIDALVNQNGGQFDPELFGNYRDTQDAILGDGNFNGGFFDDAFPLGGYGSPNFHFGNTPSIETATKPNPLDIIEKIQDGDDDEVVPGEDMSQMLNCHKIWDKLASRSDFKDGLIDIDGLCSELRAKARCSESGVVVDNKDVEAALKRLPQQPL